MKTLKYSLEYHCYPIWYYDESGELIDNDLPDEMRDDEELDSLLLIIQKRFDDLYIDTPKEFSSHGFKSETERQDFMSLLFSSVALIQQRYGANYLIDCSYNENSFPVVEAASHDAQ
ncbi:MAG: hypothetical protein IKO45_00705 [Clostridia bacterium]|nr:hypothetical protein [Clostridia bacterium]